MLRTLASQSQAAQLRVVGWLYKLAYLEGRKRAGTRLHQDEADELAKLSGLLGGDAQWGRRRYVRVPTKLVASLLRPDVKRAPAVVVNMSTGGFYLATTAILKPGDHLKIRMGDPNDVDYVFACEVRRVTTDNRTTYAAVSFRSIPLEMRRGETGPQVPAFVAVSAIVSC